MTYVLLVPGVLVFVIALVLVCVLRKLACDADREVRRAMGMLTPLSEVSVMQSEQAFRPKRKPAGGRNWRTSKFSPHASIAELVEP
jgi:hypothetical protein